MSVLDELMLEYVQLLKRYNKAAHYMDDPGIPTSKKEAWAPELRTIIGKLDNLISQIEEAGLKMSDRQILEGFQEEA